MYICVCKAVTDSQILTAIEQGVCTRKKLTHCFGIGKDCGKCNKEVIAMLEQNTTLVQALPTAKNQVIELPLTNNWVVRQNAHKPLAKAQD